MDNVAPFHSRGSGPDRRTASPSISQDAGVGCQRAGRSQRGCVRTQHHRTGAHARLRLHAWGALRGDARHLDLLHAYAGFGEGLAGLHPRDGRSRRPACEAATGCPSSPGSRWPQPPQAWRLPRDPPTLTAAATGRAPRAPAGLLVFDQTASPWGAQALVGGRSRGLRGVPRTAPHVPLHGADPLAQRRHLLLTRIRTAFGLLARSAAPIPGDGGSASLITAHRASRPRA